MGSAEISIATSTELRRLDISSGYCYPDPGEVLSMVGFGGFVFAHKRTDPWDSIPLTDFTIEYDFQTDGPSGAIFLTAPDNDAFSIYWLHV